MPPNLPPPGPERDAEIARLLGWLEVESARTPDGPMWTRGDGLYHPWGLAYSTNPAACDQLEAELSTRGYEVQVDRIAGYFNVFVRRGADELVAAITESRPDAVSAAALLALRGAQ